MMDQKTKEEYYLQDKEDFLKYLDELIDGLKNLKENVENDMNLDGKAIKIEIVPLNIFFLNDCKLKKRG